MTTLEEIAVFEGEYAEGKPALGRAFQLLRSRWEIGARDRETALRLMFLAWYAHAEPPALTGLPAVESTAVLIETAEFLDAENSMDAEVCFVVSHMVEVCGWCFGNENRWKSAHAKMLRRSLKLRPQGFSAEHFANRGAYGRYFMHIAKSGTIAS